MKAKRKAEPVAKLITQGMLHNLNLLQIQRYKLQEAVRRLDAEIARCEPSIMQALKDGWTIEAGDLRPIIEETSRRVVAWKDVFARRCGAEAVELVLQSTTPTTYEHVKIIPTDSE